MKSWASHRDFPPTEKNHTEVNLTVTLPPDMAAEAEAAQRDEPEFLSRVVLYGLTRRMIYRGIRDRHLAQEAGA